MPRRAGAAPRRNRSTHVVVLHIAAGRLALADDEQNLSPAAEAPWLVTTRADAVPEGGAVVVRPPDGEPVAIFRLNAGSPP